LENRTLDSKIEMDVLDALDAIKAVNQRHERIDTNKVIDILNKKDQGSKENMQIADRINEDEELVKSIKFKSSQNFPSSSSNSSIAHSAADWSDAGSRNGGVASIIHQQIKNKQSSASASLTSSSAPVIMIRKRKMEAIVVAPKALNNDGTNNRIVNVNDSRVDSLVSDRIVCNRAEDISSSAELQVR